MKISDKFSNAVIKLESNTATIFATQTHSNVTDWCEFHFISDKNLGINIGGEIKTKFYENLYSILNNENGKELASIKNPLFIDVVRDLKSRYVGYLVFSGYKTIYFFVDSFGYMHLILADCAGEMLVHSKLEPNTIIDWKRQLLNLKDLVITDKVE